MFIKFRFIR